MKDRIACGSYDTAAAVSTPRGRGGIAVLRVSGPDALEICGRVFVPASGKKLSETGPSRAVYGTVFFEGRPVDDGIATVFRAPRSYTGEDVVEISVHGGILITETVLSALLAAGAVPAGPGEFTKRAFINGKLDLTGAEAVADMIDAVSRDGLYLSRAQMSGTLSGKISEISDMMTDLLAEAYVTSDYPDEDLSVLTDGEYIGRISEIRESLEKLLSTYSSGRAVTEGIATAVIGAPNVGKSSLLNALSGRDRAIVTDIPGTTRDTLEETVGAGRAVLRLTDTAGIRKTDDRIEKIGIERAKKAAADSDLIICVLDGSRDTDDADRELLGWIAGLCGQTGKTAVAAVNKCDAKPFRVPELPDCFDAVFSVSALRGDGLDALKNGISDLFVDGRIDFSNDAVLSNARQYSAVSRARDLTVKAYEAALSGCGRDISAFDLEDARTALCETDGRSTASEITDRIFSRFCVGK